MQKVTVAAVDDEGRAESGVEIAMTNWKEGEEEESEEEEEEEEGGGGEKEGERKEEEEEVEGEKLLRGRMEGI